MGMALLVFPAAAPEQQQEKGMALLLLLEQGKPKARRRINDEIRRRYKIYKK
jgi:hypothetical protein